MSSGTGRWALASLALVALAATAGGALLLAEGDRLRPAPVRASISVADALTADDPSGFARALAPRTLSFPADHGSHPGFRTEWWYFTGNLETGTGRHFGFQLTFFRTALVPPLRRAGGPRRSAWATAQVYLAHFAVTDTAGRRFLAWSRTGRGALGLAGAGAPPLRVWVDDWSVEGAGPRTLPLRLRAAEAAAAVDLTLDSVKPVVLQGERGLSRKGPEPGNASYYYSLTRMPARGRVRVGGERFDVHGLAWMDHEWSTSALGGDLVGWDWFALQLDDGRDVTLYRLRRRDGTADPRSAGAVVDAAGRARALTRDDFRIEALGAWTSPASGVRYPSGWRLTLPREGLALEVTPRLADQELRVGARYWEGAVVVPGAGRGYAELVGYGD